MYVDVIVKLVLDCGYSELTNTPTCSFKVDSKDRYTPSNPGMGWSSTLLLYSFLACFMLYDRGSDLSIIVNSW